MVPVTSFGVRLVLVIVVAGVVCRRLTRRFLLRSQQRFLTDISHELLSLLARQSLALELAKRKLGDGIVEHARMEREIDSATDHPWPLEGARSVYQYSAAEGDPEALRGAIENGIRNAVRYTPQSSEVTVALANHGRTGEISISISDRGPGAPADTRPLAHAEVLPQGGLRVTLALLSSTDKSI